MKKGSLGKSFISESGKKIKNKKNGKTSSTDVDSKSQKHFYRVKSGTINNEEYEALNIRKRLFKEKYNKKLFNKSFYNIKYKNDKKSYGEKTKLPKRKLHIFTY